eukprot:m.222329 g.222329  ORF g.222329 m.222329 type:complete len:1028 (+) comp33371_c0_seq5:262-3345(+)
MLQTFSWFVLLFTVLTVSPSLSACIFDCHTNVCGGGRAVEYTDTIFTFPYLSSKDFITEINTSVLRTLDLSDRGISAIAEGGLECYFENMSVPNYVNSSEFMDFDYSSEQTQAIVFDNNLLTTLPNMSMFNGTSILSVRNNLLTSVPTDFFVGQIGSQMLVDLHQNNITKLDENALNGFTGDYLFLYLQENQVSKLPKNIFAGFTGEILMVYLNNNNMEEIEVGAFAGFKRRVLGVDLQFNNIASLPTAVFSGFEGTDLGVVLQHNNMSDVGQIFLGYAASGFTNINLAQNNLMGKSLQLALASFTTAPTSLVLNMSYNNISHVPPNLIDGIAANTALGVFVDLMKLDLSYNPIETLHEDMFVGRSYLLQLEIDISETTIDAPLQAPSAFKFGMPASGWSLVLDSLTIWMSHTGVSMSVIDALSNFDKTMMLEVDLSFNSYTYVDSNAFHRSLATSINLSNNAITYIDIGAFNFTRRLQTFDLANNLLTVMHIALMSNTPAVATLDVAMNHIWALPNISNHIGSAFDARNNVLSCDSYGPSLVGCRCNDEGLVFSQHCGYGRCLPTATGCAVMTLFDSLDCSVQPFSKCLNMCPENKYYDSNVQTCLPISNCSTSFEDPQIKGRYLAAYEFFASTSTTNRLCSICSVCPSGYDPTPCTETSNTECSRDRKLNPGDIASIVLSTIVLAISAGVGLLFGYTQSKKRAVSVRELEMTELLLGDVTEEKDRMKQAWSIDESDIKVNEVIGRGGFGTVYAGRWGHIPVAVKVLRIPLDDVNPLMSEDFNREVSFMQSIRHPNLLTFYGAGINSEQQAFLVTELMAEGSLRKLLMDAKRELSWNVRLSFTIDIARGMNYLHEKGTLHRDLKADNCFVDTSLRVKVADFGTGKFQSSFRHTEKSNRASMISLECQDRTLTKGMGSLLWMAPEALSGSVIKCGLGPAIDVYSFGMVMWEIWGRDIPWNEISCNGVEFFDELLERVCIGESPDLPQKEAPPPANYQALMRQCCQLDPADRPTFKAIVDSLALIVKS